MTIDDELDYIENAIIERLKGKITDLKTEGFPENPDEYKLTHPKGAILVGYYGSDFSEPFSDEDVMQDEDMQFGMEIQIRGLRHKNGAYKAIKRIRRALQGFEIDGCKAMRPKAIKFVSQETGIWTYLFIFKLRRKVTPDYDD
jgi:hypothetical protein